MFRKNYRSSKVRLILALVFMLGASNRMPARAWADITTEKLTQQTHTAHYIVFEKRADGSIHPAYYQLVEMQMPLQSLTDSQMIKALSQASRNHEQMVATLQTANGQVLYQNSVPVSSWLRGEFHGATADAPIDGHFVPLETSSFVVRVPQITGTQLILKNERLERVAQFDMQSLAIETPPIELDPAYTIRTINASSGPASNRQDFLIMGDGYTSSQNAKFTADASAVATSFFSISPYSVYSNYYNIHTLFTASGQAGADHPPYSQSCGYSDPNCCGDAEMQYDPLRGTIVNTAFDSRFCAYWTHRLLVADTSKVLAAAAAVPEWDSILLLVNDTTYGGSGGYVSVVSMASTAPLIAQHEYGHSFVGLADEYESPYPGYPTCSDIAGSSPCEPNVTDVTNPLQIKWKPWINLSTPIPTPNDPFYQGIVGLFQGARYLSTGMYRPGYSCIMRMLGAPYCQVASQAYVLRLYSDISLIEPGTLSPGSPTINLTHPATQTFHAGILSPVGGPPVQITWLDNGVPIPNQTSDTYIFTSSINTSGLHQITLRVKDATSLVIPAMAGNALQDEFTWTVSVEIPGSPDVVSSVRANPNPTKAASVNFIVTFSEGVTGVDITDFALTTTGLTDATILAVNGAGATYTVTVDTGAGDGTIRLDLVDNDSIKDAANNLLGGIGIGNGNFSSGETYTITKDIGAVSKWTSAFDLSHGWTVSQFVRTVGDLNGDGRDDLVGFGLDGVYVSLSTGSSFPAPGKWTSAFDLSHGWTVSQFVRTVGDVNGDGKDDLVGFGLDGVYVSLSTGSSFPAPGKWTSAFDLSHGWTVSDFVRTVGDVNGDGKADLVGFGLDGVYVSLSTGSSFPAPSKWTNAFDLSHGWTVSQFVRTVGDVNGDGKADLIGFGLDGVYVALSNGGGFGSISKWTSAFDLSHGWTVSQFVRTVGDINGDGKADLVGFGLDGVYIALSTGNGFTSASKWTRAFDLSHGWTVSQFVRTVGDVSGDGKADLVGFGLDGVYVATSK